MTMQPDFLPISQQDLKKRGWNELDIVLITGDAYVDHPSYGAAVIGRVLEHAGFKVGIISQPDWRNTADFKRLGRPRLFFGITAGNMDSMVANYTAHKRPRKKDDYSPGGKPGLRPDQATIVYANRVREAFGDVLIVIGGIEASLRRFAHYDWWDNGVRRSILLDARADILVYGMGEKQVVGIARRIRAGKNLEGIRGTVIVRKEGASKDPGSGISDRGLSGKGQLQIHGEAVSEDAVLIPSYEEVKENKEKFNEAFRHIYENQNPYMGKTLMQRHGTRYVVQYPPAFPLPTPELDRIYELPYMRRPHPAYGKAGGVPGFETVKFSIISHRGCCGECSFCSLSMHQGRIVQSRSAASVINEARLVAELRDFKGTITDIGGPTANLFGATCTRWNKNGACPDKHCLVPERCRNLTLAYKEFAELLSEILRLPKVKHVFIESGIRYDLLTDKESEAFLRSICKHHISGRMKVAPEHTVDRVLKIMNKPPFEIYGRFAQAYRKANESLAKDQYLVHYFISAHPGSTLDDTLSLALTLMERKIHPEQIQDFTPLPLTLSGTMYYTEADPFSGREVYVPKTFRERKMHRALIQHKNPSNREMVREALKVLHKGQLFKHFA